MASKGQEIVVLRASDSPEALEELKAILRGQKDPGKVQDDPAMIQREIIEQILAASSDDEMQLGDATPWQDLLDVPVEVFGFRFRPSDYSEGSPVFVVVNGIRLDTGDVVVLTTGGLNVIAQLINLAERDRLPSVWKLAVPNRASAAGHLPLRLVAVTSEVAEAHKAANAEGNPLDED